MSKPVRAFALLAAFVLLSAQAPSPYAGHASREIKALSDEETADLLAGRGMGLAVAAEMNGYPGPMHVLELADALHLTPEQRAATAALIAPMRERAQQLGRDVVAAEAALERAFVAHTLDSAALQAQVMRIAELRGRLRAVHLETHLAQRAILRPEQLAHYAALRGYGDRGSPTPAPAHPMRGHRH